MSAAACKVIINHKLSALAEGLSQVLRAYPMECATKGIDPDVMLDRMIDIEVTAVGQLVKIQDELVAAGVLDGRVNVDIE
jgi:hypothetical protein